MLRSSTETYPLTTIDLCNLSILPLGERYRSLRAWSLPSRWVSYAPIGLHWAKLVFAEPSLDLDLKRDNKEALFEQIRRDCRYGEGDITANFGVADAIWDWALESNVRSLHHRFEPYRTPLAVNRFFQDTIILLGDKAYGVFLAPRRSSSNLSAAGRDFAFSAMYWMVAGIDDYVDLDLAVLRITDGKTRRKVDFIPFSGPPVFSKSEVVERVEETQRAWLDIQLERRDNSSRGQV